jgi:hypothetical protein
MEGLVRLYEGSFKKECIKRAFRSPPASLRLCVDPSLNTHSHLPWRIQGLFNLIDNKADDGGFQVLNRALLEP